MLELANAFLELVGGPVLEKIVRTLVIHRVPPRPDAFRSSAGIFPNESLNYRFARDRLLTAEREAPRSTETAQLRRVLPPGGLIPSDYAFDYVDANDAIASKPLSAFFDGAITTLVLYSIHEPSCLACAVSLERLTVDRAQLDAAGIAFAVVVKTSLQPAARPARDRRFGNLPIYSAAYSTFHRDYCAEGPAGEQRQLVTAFRKNVDGIHHFWTPERWLTTSAAGEGSHHHDLALAIEDVLASISQTRFAP